ncbi:MAG TPA: MBOAT family protein [Acidimicrobiia bacterium]|jgi:D-alanyl-lipoteichoic acid acyltransferase DltB (MBOAT superfamily)
MLFPTISFALFFMIVLPVSWLLLPRRRRWKLFMIAASFFFYGYWDWRFCFLLAGSTIANQLFARLIHASDDERARRRWLVVAVAANLIVLGFFKYYDFFVTSATNTLHDLGLGVSPELVSVVLPIGISFFTFQALSYVIDIYRGTFEPGRLLDFAVFLSFFPHVVAGPIVRPAEFMPQLKARHDPRRVDASRAFFLIFIGLFKKVVIANLLATEIVDPVFASPLQHSSLEVLVAIYGYAVQIYADFSGYTDMAIGLALLLGFRFPQNFDSPYTAESIQDFWRRWHMTLSRWLRDYLYIPLGGNRRSSRRTYVNLMLTMLLGGLWHGAAWTFVVWGGIHGFYLSMEHLRRSRRERLGLPEPPDTLRRRWMQRIITFNLVCFAWVFFRSESLENAFDVLIRLVDPSHWFDPAPLVTLGVLLAIAAGLAEQYIPRGAWSRAMARFSYLAPAVQGVVLGVALLFTNTMGPSGVAPFIYFRF